MRIILVILLSAFVSSSARKANEPATNNEISSKERFFESRWSGSITFEQTMSGILGTSERHVTVSFTNALPTLNRDNQTEETEFTDDKGTGSETFEAESVIEGKRVGRSSCSGSGKTELHAVDIDKDGNYYIHAIGPSCTGIAENFITHEAKEVEPYTTDITISDKVLGSGDMLSGAKTETSDLGGGAGTVTTTTTWHLSRSTANDVELIVKPEDYDRWLPEPGKDESQVGSIMNISLKLQKRGGGSTAKKAKAFELHLSNTSKEPGITINYPVAPFSDPMFDLRFEKQTNGAVAPDFQKLNISCPGGCQTANAKIGSYDGGGWTVLTVEAILTDNSRIQGRLLESNGEMDIRIPKRDPNSKIGEKWLKENSNPNEMDDDEVSKGNSNDGDGLTAYEEYRGVISEGTFKRLDPTKKEVGIWATQSDFSLFAQGIGWFKNASGLNPVHFDFDKNEIAPGGKLNSNAKTAHDFDQYAIYLFNGGLGGTGTLGITYSRNNLFIPANVRGVVIDWNYIQVGYRNQAAETRPEALKFTLNEYLAQTVAHELGHAVNIKHHGKDIRLDNYDAAQERYVPYVVRNVSDNLRIFDRNGRLITTRPCSLSNVGGRAGTVESGDLTCMLNYYPYYSWGYSAGADGAYIYNQERLLRLGRIFCTSKNATEFNTTDLFFGDAATARGNCLSQIKLKN